MTQKETPTPFYAKISYPFPPNREKDDKIEDIAQGASYEWYYSESGPFGGKKRPRRNHGFWVTTLKRGKQLKSLMKEEFGNTVKVEIKRLPEV